MAFPYKKWSIVLTSDFQPRTRDILMRRFGLDAPEPETLEAIGQRHGITRERVRQIVEEGIRQAALRAREEQKAQEAWGDMFDAFSDVVKDAGYLKRQDLLIEELKAQNEANVVVFLLHLADSLYKQKETERVHPFWAGKKEVHEASIAALEQLLSHLEARKEALELEDLVREHQALAKEKLHARTLASLLEVSKHLAQAPDGKWGLRSWPEVYPKGMRDKAYVVLKNTKKPLHFEEVAQLISQLQERLEEQSRGWQKKHVLPQTVHNELIKDDRFVLVGRGTYGLAEWGLRPGTVKEVMLEILKENGSRMSKEELIQKTLDQRQVKESTILLNLQDKTCFLRDDNGFYCLPK